MFSPNGKDRVLSAKEAHSPAFAHKMIKKPYKGAFFIGDDRKPPRFGTALARNNAFKPAAQTAQHLVGDGSRLFGEFAGGDLLAARFANQHGGVA